MGVKMKTSGSTIENDIDLSTFGGHCLNEKRN